MAAEQELCTSTPESLVVYGSPIFSPDNTKSEHVKDPLTIPSAPKAKGKDKASQISQIEDILNSILPPQCWEDPTGKWIRYTAPTPSTRLDVIALQEKMDAKLIARQARDTGICAVREDIYSQCFEEMIRQITINCPERGLLLLRARDEIRMTIDAYKTLYDSSITFGVRKQIQAENGIGSLEEKIDILSKEKNELNNKVLELRNKVDVFEKRASERRALQEKKYKEEIDFLKYQGQHLEAFLKSVGGSGK